MGNPHEVGEGLTSIFSRSGRVERITNGPDWHSDVNRNLFQLWICRTIFHIIKIFIKKCVQLFHIFRWNPFYFLILASIHSPGHYLQVPPFFIWLPYASQCEFILTCCKHLKELKSIFFQFIDICSFFRSFHRKEEEKLNRFAWANFQPLKMTKFYQINCLLSGNEK